MIGRPLSPISFAGARRRGRRRGLIVGAAVGASVARSNASKQAATANVQMAQPASQPAVSQQTDTIAQLQQLAQLKEQGILTEAEFADQKAKILAQ